MGDRVNIETDMIGKYVEKFLSGRQPHTSGKGRAGGGVDMDLLAKSGFL
jgi:riboflavin synthase